MSQSSEVSLIPAPTYLGANLLAALHNREYDEAHRLLDNLSHNPDMIHREIITAAIHSGSIPIYNRICELVKVPNLLEATHFDALVRDNKHDIIRLLIQAYPDAVHKLANPSDAHEPPIHLACRSSNAEVASLLIEFTTKETALRYSSNNLSLLMEATVHSPDCTELLTNQPYINDLILVEHGQYPFCAPLHNAARNCKYQIFRRLYQIYIALGSVSNHAKITGCNVLISLMEPDTEDEAMQFIGDVGHNHPSLTNIDSHKCTPLHWAAIYGFSRVIDLLYPIYVTKGLVLARTKKCGHTFFNYLIHHNHLHIIKDLLERDDFDLRLVSVPDKFGKSPMLHAIDMKHTNIYELLYPFSVSTGSIAIPHKYGLNVLMAAVALNLQPVVQLLTSDPKVCLALMVGSDEGATPLHHAVYESLPEMTSLLCERSTPEQLCLRTNNWGLTALHWAIMYRGVSMIESLLRDHVKARIMMEVKDVDGLTAIDYARMRSPEITAMLEAVMSV